MRKGSSLNLFVMRKLLKGVVVFLMLFLDLKNRILVYSNVEDEEEEVKNVT